MIALRALFLLLPALALASPVKRDSPPIPSNPAETAGSTVIDTAVISTSSASTAAVTSVTPISDASPTLSTESLPVVTTKTSSTGGAATPTQSFGGGDFGEWKQGFRIRSNRDSTCLTIQTTKGLSDGQPVISTSCDRATTWIIKEGSGSIIASDDERFALDAGEWPGNGGKLKVWTSYPGLMQQTWYLTDDKRIAITGGTQCLDQSEKGEPQLWQCTDNNTNQIWFVEEVPRGPIVNKPIIDDESHCVTVMDNVAKEGSAVQIAKCFEDNNEWSKMQRWDFFPGQQANHVKLHSKPELCLTADKSKKPIITLQKCEGAKEGQGWTYYGGRELKLRNSDQCLDVQSESTSVAREPYDSLKDLQTWSCGNPHNRQQSFYVPEE